ncbi:MAG: asparaginase [Paucimonas sp.]|jgi:L-asparaginase|nr:asparaginase [Paucimonas sp.]
MPCDGLRYDAASSRARTHAMELRIIAAGGTFDKHYDEIAGRLDFAHSHLPEAIARARITERIEFEQVFLLDSLDMTDSDRRLLLDACVRAAESAIVIVHGTDTMAETARLISEAGLAKTVILTGAMVPYELAHSDAMFNLGFACGAAQLLPPGVYVAMNGRVFNAVNVAKNRAQGVFEEGKPS